VFVEGEGVALGEVVEDSGRGEVMRGVEIIGVDATGPLPTRPSRTHLLQSLEDPRV
jgi:hypothetical protein